MKEFKKGDGVWIIDWAEDDGLANFYSTTYDHFEKWHHCVKSRNDYQYYYVRDDIIFHTKEEAEKPVIEFYEKRIKEYTEVLNKLNKENMVENK